MILLLMLTIGLVGCNNTEKEPELKTNYFTIDSVEYSLSKGLLEEFEDNSGFYASLVLTKGIDYVSSSFNGNGEFISFEFFITSNNLLSGTYSFSDFPNRTPDSYARNLILVEYDPVGMTNKEAYGGTSGEVIVNIDGDIYTIDFDLIVEKDTMGSLEIKKVKGNFTGMLTKI